MESHQLKLAGLVAGVIVVGGILSWLAFAPEGIKGISASVGQQPSTSQDYAWIMRPDWQRALVLLRSYVESDNATRERIIQEVIQVLESARTR